MLNQHIKDEENLIEFQPMVDKDALGRAQNQTFYRAINFRLANVNASKGKLTDDSPLSAIMKASGEFSKIENSPLQVEMTIKIPGHTRDFSLNNSSIVNLLTHLLTLHTQANDEVDKLTVRGATDEASQIETIDLLGPIVRDKVVMDTDESRYIDSNKLMEKMLKKYSQIRNRF